MSEADDLPSFTLDLPGCILSQLRSCDHSHCSELKDDQAVKEKDEQEPSFNQSSHPAGPSILIMRGRWPGTRSIQGRTSCAVFQPGPARDKASRNREFAAIRGGDGTVHKRPIFLPVLRPAAYGAPLDGQFISWLQEREHSLSTPLSPCALRRSHEQQNGTLIS